MIMLGNFLVTLLLLCVLILSIGFTLICAYVAAVDFFYRENEEKNQPDIPIKKKNKTSLEDKLSTIISSILGIFFFLILPILLIYNAYISETFFPILVDFGTILLGILLSILAAFLIIKLLKIFNINIIFRSE